MAEYIDRETAIVKAVKCIDNFNPLAHDIKEAIKAIPNADVVPRKDYESMERTVDKLNKALAERKHGKWIWDDEGYHCSECFFHAYGNTGEILSGDYHFCPNCGAKMESEDDDEHTD